MDFDGEVVERIVYTRRRQPRADRRNRGGHDDGGFDVPEIQRFSDGHALFLRDADGMRIELGVYG